MNQDTLPDDIELEELLQDIKDTFKINYVPVMFTFLRRYPVFLKRLWESIKLNLQDDDFADIIEHIKSELSQTLHTLNTSSEFNIFAHKILPSSEIKNVAQDTFDEYFDLQCRLAFISIAIRERTKGWALGAKKLEQQTEESYKTLFDKETLHVEINELMIRNTSNELSHRPNVQEPLLSFILYIQQIFKEKVKTDEYLFARVKTEEMFMRELDNIPHPIFASYNQVYKSVPATSDIIDLFYLLSDKFPVVHVVSALMWGFGNFILEEYDSNPVGLGFEEAEIEEDEDFFGATSATASKKLPEPKKLLEKRASR